MGRRSGKCGWCTKKGVGRCDHSQHSVSFPKKWFKMLHLCPLPLTFMVRPGQRLVVNLNFFIFSVLPQGYVCDRYGIGVLTRRLVRHIKRIYKSVVKVTPAFWPLGHRSGRGRRLRSTRMPAPPLDSSAVAAYAPPRCPSVVGAGAGAVAFAAPPYGPSAIGVGAGAGSDAFARPAPRLLDRRR